MVEVQKRIFGQRNRCPTCSEMPPIEDGWYAGETACGYCQSPLWYVRLMNPEVWYYSVRRPNERIEDFLADVFADLDPRERETLIQFITNGEEFPNADSLDRVELVMEVTDLLRERVT